jgi:hypothetical protein
MIQPMMCRFPHLERQRPRMRLHEECVVMISLALRHRFSIDTRDKKHAGRIAAWTCFNLPDMLESPWMRSFQKCVIFWLELRESRTCFDCFMRRTQAGSPPGPVRMAS